MSSQESNKTSSRNSKIMLLLVIISLFSKLFGFARDIILSNSFGAGIVADAYLLTLSIPDMFLDLFANTAMMGFVPLAVEKLNSSRDEINNFSSSACKLLLAIALVFTAVLSLFPEIMINILAPGFEGEKRALAILFLRIISFTMLFRSITSVFNSYLSANKYFVPAAFLGITLDISIIIAIIVSSRFDLVYILPFGVLLGTVLQTLLLMPFSIKKGLRLKVHAPIFSKDMRNLLVMSIPAMFSVGLMQLSTIFNRALASEITTGAITMLNHSSKISFFVENIIVSSIATVLYPLLAEYHLTGRKDMIQNVLGDTIDKLITFLLPASVGLAMLSEPIIDFLFGNGQFTEENVKVTAVLMTLQVIGILGIAVQTLLTRALFSMKKIKLSIFISISLLITYVAISFALSRIWGLYGIALATGLSYTVGGIVYYVIVNKICNGINVKTTGIVFLKSSISCALMAVVVFLITNFLPISPLWNMILAVGAGVIVYFAAAQVLRLQHISIKPILNKLKTFKK